MTAVLRFHPVLIWNQMGRPKKGVRHVYLGEAHVSAHALATAIHIPHLDLAIQASRQQQVPSLGEKPVTGTHTSANPGQALQLCDKTDLVACRQTFEHSAQQLSQCRSTSS